MAIRFDQIQVLIGGSSILCQNAQLDSASSPAPSVTMGYLRPIGIFPQGPIKNNLTLNYLLEPGNEPIFRIYSGIRTGLRDINPTIIKLGGITGSYYLEGYSFQVIPNENVKATAQFASYANVSGNIAAQATGLITGYNVFGSSRIAHYFTSYPTNSNNSVQGNLLQLGFNARIEMEPVYNIGSKGEPSQVSFIGMREDFDLMGEIYTSLTYNPQDAAGTLPNIAKINLFNISSLWTGTNSYSMEFSLTNYTLNSYKVSAPSDNIVTINTSISKYF